MNKGHSFNRNSHLVEVFADTLRIIQTDKQLKEAVERSIAAQQYIPDDKNIDLPAPSYNTPATITVSRLRSFEAAANYKDDKVAVLNFASATTPGGGVTAGASAQEECLCRVSTLYPCLNAKSAWDNFYSPHRHLQNPLHNDDIIYTKDVVVLKDDNHNILTEPFCVDVITCAAPNLRDHPSNRYNHNDGDPIKIGERALLLLHERRARKILSAAAANHAETVILGAFGCGAFRNNPNIVAQAYNNVLNDFLHHFRNIEFAVYSRFPDSGNFTAFKDIITLQ